MIASTIFNQLHTTLKNDATLSTYISNVFKGRRFDIEPESLPCIMLEPKEDNDLEREMNNVRKVFFNVDIYAFSSASPNDFDKSIVGDDNYKGILDVENDIRSCLLGSYSLGGNVFDIRFDKTIFDQVDIKAYPVRGMLMPIRILYQQQNGV